LFRFPRCWSQEAERSGDDRRRGLKKAMNRRPPDALIISAPPLKYKSGSIDIKYKMFHAVIKLPWNPKEAEGIFLFVAEC
jgi:hypothetical protein